MNKLMGSLTIIGLFGLTGCPVGIYDQAEPLNAGQGNGHRLNSAIVIIDPVPANVNDGAPAMSGERAAIMLERHATGTEEEAVAPTTSE